MKIFELHFNPKLKDDAVFESFIYEPENIYEKKLGSLYIVGELQNALPSHLRFLDNLAKTIKAKYYTLSLKTPEKALSEALKKTNDFLYEEVKKENVSWLGNLDLAALSIKNFDLIFTKTGSIKVLLLRGTQLIDIGKNLEPGEIEPYPLKVFFNVVSGQLAEDDKILVLTKDVYNLFLQEKIMEKIIKAEAIDEKNLKEILPSQLFEEESNLKISGICFLIIIKEMAKNHEKPQEIQFKKSRKFSIKKRASLIYLKYEKILKKFFQELNLLNGGKTKANKTKAKLSGRKKIGNLSDRIKVLKKYPKKIFRQFTSRLNFLNFPRFNTIIKNRQKRKNLILLVSFIIVLLAGFLMFRWQGDKKESNVTESFNQIEKKVFQAESFIIFKNEEKADALLKEAWREIMPMTQTQSSLRVKANSLKDEIEKTLSELNKIEQVKNPTVMLDLSQLDIGFIPEKMMLQEDNFYFYTPNTSNFYAHFTKEETGDLFNSPESLKIGCLFPLSAAFLSPQNKLLFFENKSWQEKNLQLPAFSINFSNIAAYQDSIYLLDQEKYEILKYNWLSYGEFGFPLVWLEDKSPEQTKPKDMAIDGSVWLLNVKNSIDLYRKGSYQETIILDFFPFPENITQIKTRAGLPYLYLLEPLKNRVVVTDKSGKVVKQFQGEKFNNLKDFEISSDGKTIWLLSGSILFQINF